MWLQLPLLVLLINTLIRARRSTLLLQLLTNRSMKFFFKDRLRLDGLELGLEVLELRGGGVAAAAGVVHVVGHVFDFVAVSAPGHGVSYALVILGGDG
jgi:hypothetical protein